ncbi:MAG: HAMP domain-containing sensor histidine kinase [Rhizomicrobium sp.]
MSETAGRFYRQLGAAIGQKIGPKILRAAGLPGRRARQLVIGCIGLISVSFALAAGLLLYFEQQHAFQQAEEADIAQAQILLATAEGNLDRVAALGLMFANGGLAEEAVAALPGIRGIAVADSAGNSLRQSGEALDSLALASLLRKNRLVIGTGNRGLIVFRDGDRLVAVSFEPSTLAPPALLAQAELVSTAGVRLVGHHPDDAGTPRGIILAGQHWPINLHYEVDPTVTGDWYRLLPLHLFLVLGPLLVGGWLMLVFWRAINWRAKAARLVRALRHSPPKESKLRMRLALSERFAAERIQDRSLLYANLARDLCTPLNAVCGFAEMIAREIPGPIDNPKYGEYARYIDSAGRQIKKRLEAVGELATIDAGHVPLAIETCDASRLVGATLRAQSGRAYAKRIRLELAPPIPVEIHIDIEIAERLLEMLLGAAMARTAPGGNIHVTIGEEPGAAIVTITDPGKLPSRTGRSGARPGIDETIAIELARMMGGGLKFAPQPGKGTVVALRLPKA